jgi:hypothetical protein
MASDYFMATGSKSTGIFSTAQGVPGSMWATAVVSKQISVALVLSEAVLVLDWICRLSEYEREYD